MADPNPSKYLTITLRELDFHEPIPLRVITLGAPDWEIRIGRGSVSRVEEFAPAEDNAWFDSRVLSRRHAILRGNPTTKEIYIQDIGSMHGTFVAGKRVNTNQMEPIWPEDTVTLGADVIRGNSHFSALRFMVTSNWCDEIFHQPHAPQTNPGVRIYQNTFSADYSDEEAYSDPSIQVSSSPEENEDEHEERNTEHHSDPEDEDQVIQDSVREASIEIVVPEVTTFAVPESDDASNTQSHASGPDVSSGESPTSSPLITSDTHEDKGAPPEEISQLFQGPGICSASSDYTDHSQVLVPNSGQQPEVLPTMDENTSEEDSYGDDELENTYSDSFSSLNIPPINVDNLAKPLAACLSPSGPTDHPEHVRAPSPSDAAMVKPTTDSGLRVTLTAPPFSSLGSSNQNPGPMDNHVAQGRLSSAWAGHNSVLYEPVAHPLVPEPSESVYYPSYRPYMSLYAGPYTFQSPVMSTQAQSAASALSFASVVSQQQASKDMDGAKKRKCDQISSDECPGTNTVSSDSYSSEAKDIHATSVAIGVRETSSVNGDTLLDPSTSEVAECNASMHVEMPARKKVKKNTVKAPEQRDGGRNSFAKTAGATIAGMAIGAVGMFIGLLALPEDYFM
ncbi:hypothetical protein Z517_11153 [Fonsecaea pedrosoi CBS 271.37]|uniref:FHA domain-containing protein n=1 Tax=Fonsecaea pedrosoi CBS 271.37 TaxID=1442368 RepID=A0A0D2EPZ8_9EURO|nr:uncharacterized protein Z517_11153 [Fonsecaea pedrosoi CBS 271.37]KIW76407.1 hypothetical protein Z517_11153 [Fonsecaea pedrosoi CBS 271.37]